jgi:hypothetical protein
MSVDNWLAQCTIYIARLLAGGGVVVLIAKSLVHHKILAGYGIACLLAAVVVIFVEVSIYRLLESKNRMLREP